MKRRLLAVLCAGILAVGLLSGCGSKETTETETAVTEEEIVEEEQTGVETTEGQLDEDMASEEETEAAGFTDGQDAEEVEGVTLDVSEELTGKHHAKIRIEGYGDIDLELDADVAPITVTNFVKLAQEGFYDGLTFHRIIEGFMMQGGDPLGNGMGGSDENIKGEFSNNGVDNDISHTRGTISMARSSAPDSASSQFFIMHEDGTYLDGDYAAFGVVTEGMDVVDAVCTDAEPTDGNGTIAAEDQPVIEFIKILD